MAQVFALPFCRATDINGKPLPGAKLYFYETGTTTSVSAYSDQNLSVAHTNPVVADSGGLFPSIYLNPIVSYRAILKTSADVTIADWDPVGDATAYTDTIAAINAAVGEITALSPATHYSGVVFGWNSDAALDSARFPSGALVGPNKVWAIYSPRKGTVNDDEHGMRTDIVEVTWDDSAGTFTTSTPYTLSTPSAFGSGFGGHWACCLHVIENGPYAGRKLAVVQELNSPTTQNYGAADSRYDLALWYTDAGTIAGPWTRVLLLSGETTHTAFGLADYNAADAGMNTASGNCMVEMPNGTLVLGGHLAGPGNGYLVSLTANALTGGLSWTPGTPLALQASDNEPALALTSTGVAAFVRNEATNQRSIYRSTNGAVWTYSRAATDIPIRNVNAAALQTSGGRILVGGATSATAKGAGGVQVADNRRGWKVFASDNDGFSFGGGYALFDEAQRIGYGCLIEIALGEYVLLTEVTSEQVGDSFNRKSSIIAARFNDTAMENEAVVTTPDYLRFVVQDEYDAYAAFVTADGGTIQSATRCRAAIESAINGNYYSSIGIAISGQWGSKGLGTVTPALYSLNRVKSTGFTNNGTMDLDTTTYSYAVVKFPIGTDIQFSNTIIRGGASFGQVIMDHASDTGATNGIGWQWTQTASHYTFAGGSANFDGATNFITGSPNYAGTQTDVMHFHFNMDELVAFAGKNGGRPDYYQSVTYFPSNVPKNGTATLKITPIGGANRHMVEAWHLNGAGLTSAMTLQCAKDVKARS